MKDQRPQIATANPSPSLEIPKEMRALALTSHGQLVGKASWWTRWRWARNNTPRGTLELGAESIRHAGGARVRWDEPWTASFAVWLRSNTILELTVCIRALQAGPTRREVAFRVLLPHACVDADVPLQQSTEPFLSADDFAHAWPALQALAEGHSVRLDAHLDLDALAHHSDAWDVEEAASDGPPNTATLGQKLRTSWVRMFYLRDGHLHLDSPSVRTSAALAADSRTRDVTHLQVFTGPAGNLLPLARSPHLVNLQRIQLGWVRPDSEALLQALGESPHLAALTELSMTHCAFETAAANALAEARGLSGLTSLELQALDLKGTDIQKLLHSETLRGLQELIFRGGSWFNGPWFAGALLKARPELERLVIDQCAPLSGARWTTTPELTRRLMQMPALRELHLKSLGFGVKHFRALSEDPVAPITHLELSGSHSDEESFARLFERFGERLEVFAFNKSNLDKEIEAFVAASFPRLERLILDEGFSYRHNPSRLFDAQMPALTHLDLSRNKGLNDDTIGKLVDALPHFPKLRTLVVSETAVTSKNRFEHLAGWRRTGRLPKFNSKHTTRYTRTEVT